MGATSTAGNTTETKNYERIEAGVYSARCFACIELGTHRSEFKGEVKDKKEIMIIWELNELMEDGRPFTVNWRGTNSLNEKGNLFKMLSGWRGKSFTPDELHKFEMKNILDKCCMLNVGKETSKAGKEYNKVITVMPLPKGMTVPPLVNPLVDFGIGDMGTPEFDKLYPWIQNVVRDSHEGQKFFLGLNNEPEPPIDDGEAF